MRDERRDTANSRFFQTTFGHFFEVTTSTHADHLATRYILGFPTRVRTRDIGETIELGPLCTTDLAMFLENKVVQKLKIEKKMFFYKKWSPKLIFF